MEYLKYENIIVAYFSAEIGINKDMKTYAGGLGVLAGDILKAAVDLKYPMCGVTLLYKKGFFKQEINLHNEQVEIEDKWDYESFLEDTKKEVKVNIDNRDVYIKIWCYWLKGLDFKIPIFFLDTDLEKNNEEDRNITKQLYLGDRLKQELVLGVGGARALDELGIYPKKFHMNEGHSSFLTLRLYKKFGRIEGFNDEVVKKRCVFTTHTPIPAGHDKFSYKEFYKFLEGEEKDLIPWHLQKLAGEDMLNTTKLAMSFSNYINAVSRKHQQVTKSMFPKFENKIDYITNGVHLRTWTSESFSKVFDKLGNWNLNPEVLLNINNIPKNELIDAKKKNKKNLVEFLNENNIVGTRFKEDILTVGFARRFISYKNAEMIFEDLERLKGIGKKVQIVFSGKSHMKDSSGKRIITRILEYAEMLKDYITIGFIENYNMEVAKLLVSGVDIWLNTPIPPNEASGTSGMKASVNGTINVSTIDGWIIESFERGFGGFPISKSDDFYNLIEYKLIPMYYFDYENSWVNEMRLSIKNGSYFNTIRVLKEYIKKGYEK